MNYARQWPAANSDIVQATYNQVISIPVLNNDEGVELKVVSVNEGSLNQGKVEIDENGVVKYQQLGEPRGNQVDEFWYVFEDKWGRRNAAKVTVNLSESSNEPWPVATLDQAKSENGLRVFIPVLENDIGDGLTLKSTNAWTQNGGKTVIVNDLIRYKPPANFTGTDAFWYVFEDSQGRTNSAKVEVEVTQNTQLSVVEYCGVTYETDGTLENTAVTSSHEIPTGPRYLSLNHTDLTHEGAFVDGRHYYRESVRNDTAGSDTIIWMEVGGVKTKVAEVESGGETLYTVGIFNKHLYYGLGNRLFAHDGSATTDLTKFMENASYSDEALDYRISSEAYGNALYLRAISSANGPPIVKNSFWRVSDGLDLKPVFLGSKISSYVDTLNPEYVYRAEIKKAYFNGLDYTAYDLMVGRESPPSTQNFEVTQQDGDSEPATIEGYIERFFENNDRFFVMTKAHHDRVDGVETWKAGKLYVIDNHNDSFVELASCNTAD